MKKILIIGFLGIVFAFVFTIFSYIFNQIFVSYESNYIQSGVGALMGAFMAFIFVRIGTFVTGISEREKRGYTELIYLQGFYNDCIQIADDNRYIMKNFERVLRSGNVYINELQIFPTKSDSIYGLTNVNFINKVYSSMVGFRKINNDINSVNRWNNELRSARWADKITLEEYKLNAIGLADNLAQLDAYLAEIENEMKDIVSEARLFSAKDKPIFNTVIEFLFNSHKRNFSAKEITKERQKLEKEIEAVRAESNAQIARAEEQAKRKEVST